MKEEARAFSEKMISLTRSIERMIIQYEIIEQNQEAWKCPESLNTSLKLGVADP